ncbi:MAG: hypothetical protein KAX65_12985 [Caldilineaceae bacterium]|nr:hypothetical protein [Caldilineaceae bacterium]
MPITHELLRLIFTFAVMFLGVRTEAGAPPPPVVATTPAASATAPATALAEALHYAPADIRLLQFGDWTLLREYAGIDGEAGPASAAETTRRLLPRTNNGEFFIPGGYASATAAVNRSLWGWDFGDLLWESALQLDDGRAAYVMRLADDYPLDELLARFAERGFGQTAVNGAILLSHTQDLSAPWSVDIAVFNAAIFPDEHVLVHAPSLESVAKVVAAATGESIAAAARPEYQDLAAQLGAAGAAVLGPFAVHCTMLDPAMLLAGDGQPLAAEAIQAAFAARFGATPMGSFLALGIGYARVDGQPVGRIVLAYPDAASAQTDLAARAAIADTGKSLLVDELVSAVIFSVDAAAAIDRTIVITVTPVNGQPGRLFTMFYNRDMGFAGCPAE